MIKSLNLARQQVLQSSLEPENKKPAKKQYVIIREGKREHWRNGTPPDPMFMLDPEEAQYRKDFMCKPIEVVDTVKSFNKVHRHAFTVTGKLYRVSPSLKLHPVCAIGPG